MNDNTGSKKLRRSRNQRLLTGVCGGIGDFFGVDANLVRLGFVAFALITSGTGFLIYIVAWLVMPEENGESSMLEHLIRNFQGKKSDL